MNRQNYVQQNSASGNKIKQKMRKISKKQTDGKRTYTNEFKFPRNDLIH